MENAPFIKVEATKFTEVGYVGRDVESIVRDLAEIFVKLLREKEMDRVKFRAEESAEEQILDILFPANDLSDKESIDNTRQLLRKNFVKVYSMKKKLNYQYQFLVAT